MSLEELKEKIEYGDYNTLGKMLDMPSPAARARFKRDDPEAIKAMELIIENKERLISDYLNK